jgi:hypothetical protein
MHDPAARATIKQHGDPVSPSPGEPDEAQHLEKEGPSDGVESFCDVDFEQYGWALLAV